MLTSDERSFLSRMELAEADVFDGRGLSRKVAQARAKDLGKAAMLSTPCREAGHRLRWVSGHCAICNPIYRAFSRRYSERAFVYVAYSERKRVCKIGLAKSVGARERTLNQQGYAGTNDWTEIESVETDDAGSVENAIHTSLRKYAVLGLYFEKEGKQQECREVFRCSPTEARRALATAVERTSRVQQREPRPAEVRSKPLKRGKKAGPASQRLAPSQRPAAQRKQAPVRPHEMWSAYSRAWTSTSLSFFIIVACRHCAQKARMDLRRPGPKCPRCGASLWDAHLIDADPK